MCSPPNSKSWGGLGFLRARRGCTGLAGSGHADPLQHFCPCTILHTKRAPSVRPKFQVDQVPRLLKFLPSVPWNLGWKDQETFLAILVAFWGPLWLPKLLSTFLGVVPSHIQNGGSRPTIAYRTHLAKYPPKLPPVMGEYCRLFQRFVLCICATCAIPVRMLPWGGKVSLHVAHVSLVRVGADSVGWGGVALQWFPIKYLREK